MIDHLSYSSISSYLYCGRSWAFKYIDQIKSPTTPELVFGSAFHGTVENFISSQAKPQKDENGNTIEPPSLIDLWNRNWTEQTTVIDPRIDQAYFEKEKVQIPRIRREDIAWDTDTPESFCNEGIRILGHKDIQAGILSIKPAIDDLGPRIERKVELRVPGVPLPIVGYIDIVTADGVPGDFKTSKSAWSLDKALGETQPLFYLAALNQAGIQTPGWRFRHYVFTKTKTPQFQAIEHTHNPGQLMWLFEMIRRVWQAIEGEHFPINPTGWKCSPNYCEYWTLCRGKHG